jgi:hypothetical protein
VKVDRDPVPVAERVLVSLRSGAPLPRESRINGVELVRERVEALRLCVAKRSLGRTPARIGIARKLFRPFVSVGDRGAAGGRLESEALLAAGSGHEDPRRTECIHALLRSPHRPHVYAVAHRSRNRRPESERFRV